MTITRRSLLSGLSTTLLIPHLARAQKAIGNLAVSRSIGFDAAQVGFVGDGITDNGSSGTRAWVNWTAIANQLGVGGTAAGLNNATYNSGKQYGTVTIAAGTPTTVTTSNLHGLEANDCFIFTGTVGATLPTGLSFNTPYFVKGNNLTSSTFQFSIINNNISNNGGEGAGVNSVGVSTGTIGLVQLNADWVEIVFPPGVYFQTSNINGQWNAGGRKFRWTGYGAFFPRGAGFGAQGALMNDSIFTSGGWQGNKVYSYVQTVGQINNSTSTITTTTVAGAALFTVNQWILLGGIDMFAGGGFPPGLREFQFLQIKDINYSTGVITVQFSGTIFNNYRSSWPQFCPPTPSGTVNSGFTGGPACIFGMPPVWDCDLVVTGIHFGSDNNFQWVSNIRTTTFIDCVFDGQGFYPTQTKKFHGIRSSWGQTIEPDKLVEEALFEDCSLSAFSNGNSSVKLLEIIRSNVYGGGIPGTCRRQVIRDSFIGALYIGSVYGMTDSCEITGTKCENFGGNSSFGLGSTGGGFGMGNGGVNGGYLGYYTFSNGTLRLPPFLQRSNLPLQTYASFAFPGNKMFFSGSAIQSNTDNMGAPFVVYDAYQDASGNLSLDTSLAALPTGFQSSSQVTITAATPAVVTWTAHGLSAGTPLFFFSSEATGGPHGLTYTTGGNPTEYFVSSTNLLSNTFEISTQSGGGGTPVNTTAGTATISAVMVTISTTGAPGNPFLVSARTISVADVPVGSNVVVAVLGGSNVDFSAGSVSDGTSNVYTFVTQTTPTVGVDTTAFFVSFNIPNEIKPGSSYNSSPGSNMIVHAFTGSAAAVDITQTQIQNAPATTNAISLTSGTLNHSNEVLFVAWNSSLPAYGFSEQSGWTNLVPGFPLSQHASCAWKVVSSNLSQVYNPTGNYILAVANPLILSSHPCPKFTANGNSGPIQLEDLNGAYEEPIYSRAKRVIAGFAETSGGQYKVMYVWGNLVSLTINVQQAFTQGGTATLTLGATGFTSNLASSNMSQVIDLTTTGVRTITTSTATGSAGADSIAAYAGWIANGITLTPGGNWRAGSPDGTLAQQPIVEITVQTTQGVHAFDGWLIVDSKTQNISGLSAVGHSGTTRLGTESQ
jgi:hypothetical protein